MSTRYTSTHPHPLPPNHKKNPPTLTHPKYTSIHPHSPSPAHKRCSLTPYPTPPISHSHIKNVHPAPTYPKFTSSLNPSHPLTHKKFTLTPIQPKYTSTQPHPHIECVECVDIPALTRNIPF